MRLTITKTVILALIFSTFSAQAEISKAHHAKADAAMAKAIKQLRSTQLPNGSWKPSVGPKEVTPAVTGMITAALLRENALPDSDPMVKKAVVYLLSTQQEDGGFYDRILPNYNTALTMMALSQLQDKDPKIAKAVKKARDYLISIQWNGQKDPNGDTIGEDHVWYGGAGYGNKGRPDLSNTAMMLTALHDSGLDCKDPAFIRAMSFISQLQGTPSNTKYADQIQKGGGFVYATSTNKDNIGKIQSQVGSITDASGRSRLRTYGSMTYAGFMSFLYAELDKDDPRVKDAFRWITNNYTLKENPGAGKQGYFYYLHIFSRAMNSWNQPIITTADGKKHNWAEELIDQIVSLQKPNGLWQNKEDRWMEADENLSTAYAILALQFAKNPKLNPQE